MKNVFLSAFICMSCTAKLEYLSQDKEFTPHQLTSGYLLVANPVMDNAFAANPSAMATQGVRQGDGRITPLLESESQVLAKIVVDEIRDENEKLKVNLLAEYKKLPVQEFKKLHEHFKNTREIPQDFLNNFSDTFMSFPSPYRFLASIRIESESKSQDYQSREETIKKAKGASETVFVEEWFSYRQMTARMQIYDLKLKKQVFDGIQTRVYSNSRDKKTKKENGGMINIVLGNREQYPPFPDRAAVFKLIAADFAGNLPNEDDE